MTKVIDSKNIIHVVRNTLNYVDTRLIGHGERVAFLVYHAMKQAGCVNQKKLIDLSMLALLHDIGAYKTEDINHMLEFESKNIWEHSVYGYLFLKNMSPLADYAEDVLYHHLPYHFAMQFPDFGVGPKHLAGLINLADRTDMVLQYKDTSFCKQYLSNNRGYLFSPYWCDALLNADQKWGLFEQLQDGNCYRSFERLLENAVFSEKEIRQYLSMIAYSIDFRSEYTVLHTVTTVSLSKIIAHQMGLSPEDQEKIFYGALLHDIGKISTPIEILEKPGKLSPEEMEIMKLHVVVTGEILSSRLDNDILKIAIRHHEKLDGSGYPIGLTDRQLNLSQRIVAVADIVSALIRKRSYKSAFGTQASAAILRGMMEDHKICPAVTTHVLNHFDQILDLVQADTEEVSKMYFGMRGSYLNVLNHIPAVLREATDPPISCSSSSA